MNSSLYYGFRNVVVILLCLCFRNIILMIDMSEASKERDFKPDRLSCAMHLLEVIACLAVSLRFD